jgi:predicted AAA+ superfamily ATPase
LSAVQGEEILVQLGRLLDRGGAPAEPPDFGAHPAWRWGHEAGGGRVVPVERPHRIDLALLAGIDDVKEALLRNTEQFVAGHPSNDVLLWGERGTGKSSCVKGLLDVFGARGLRLVELQRWELLLFPRIAAQLRDAPYRFILFCDDLSFDEGESDFRALKTLLDGGLEERPANIRIYATSNRRHLMPEKARLLGGDEEMHPADAISEKLSLSDRFGIQLGFYRFDQETYLSAVRRHARALGLPVDPARLEREALAWALDRGNRSGRTAKQFVDDLAGRLAIGI